MYLSTTITPVDTHQWMLEYKQMKNDRKVKHTSNNTKCYVCLHRTSGELILCCINVLHKVQTLTNVHE